MGIYYAYGIEYSLKLKDGRVICLVHMNQADERLLESSYYQQRKQYYEKSRLLEWHEKVDNCDCKLTPNEEVQLNELLNKYKDEVIEHGWYDVKRYSSTLF